MKLTQPRRPTAGRPKPLALCSLILLSPDADLKLDGISMHAVFKSTGREALMKGVERMMASPERGLTPRLAQHLSSMLADVHLGETKDLLLRAMEGDTQAQGLVDRMGPWYIARETRKAAGATPFQLIRPNHCVEVETASANAMDLVHQRDYCGAAQAVAADPQLRLYMSDPAVAALAAASTPVQAGDARAAGAFEFLLSQVSRIDVMTREHRGARAEHDGFERLLQSGRGDTCRPGRELLRWLMEQVEVRTLPQLMALDCRREHPMEDDSALKRWSSGAEFPSTDHFLPFARSVIETAIPSNRIETLLVHADIALWAARRLHKLLELVRFGWMRADAAQLPDRWRELLGGPTPEDWSRSRYQFWLAHWRANLPALDGDAAAPQPRAVRGG